MIARDPDQYTADAIFWLSNAYPLELQSGAILSGHRSL